MGGYQSLGHMPRAPLVYTLAMVEIGRIPVMEQYAASVQEALRHEYPELGEFEIRSFKVNLDPVQGKAQGEQTTIKQWKANTADHTFGVVFDSDRLVLHTIGYSHFNDFAKRLRHVLDVLVERSKVTHTRRIGMRYIDVIEPIDNYGLDGLVQPALLSPQLGKALVPTQSRVEYVYTSESGQLFLRCYQLRNHPGVPQDLMPLVDQLVNGGAPMAVRQQPFILVDTDHVHIPNSLEVYDRERVIEKLDALHQQASLAFRTAVTPNALTAWNKEG